MNKSMIAVGMNEKEMGNKITEDRAEIIWNLNLKLVLENVSKVAYVILKKGIKELVCFHMAFRYK